MTLIVDSGSINLNGQATLALSPPTSGTYANITMYQPASNTSTVSFSGQNSDVTGTLYFPSAAFQIDGQSGASTGTQIICYDLHITGQSTIDVQNGYRFGPSALYLVQ